MASLIIQYPYNIIITHIFTKYTLSDNIIFYVLENITHLTLEMIFLYDGIILSLVYFS